MELERTTISDHSIPDFNSETSVNDSPTFDTSLDSHDLSFESDYSYQRESFEYRQDITKSSQINQNHSLDTEYTLESIATSVITGSLKICSVVVSGAFALSYFLLKTTLKTSWQFTLTIKEKWHKSRQRKRRMLVLEHMLYRKKLFRQAIKMFEKEKLLVILACGYCRGNGQINFLFSWLIFLRLLTMFFTPKRILSKTYSVLEKFEEAEFEIDLDENKLLFRPCPYCRGTGIGGVEPA